jgi:flagellar P-ring protein precursor FlgI
MPIEIARRTVLFLVIGLLVIRCADAGTRLKDLVSVEGVRDNQLVGYGVVVGLNGTGDKRQSVFSAQTLTNVLQRMGVAVNPNSISVRNTAAVMITASLPPFAQPGTKVDVSVAAVADAASLQGGLLILTPLKGANGQVYAVAQGAVITGGFVAGRVGNSQTTNHPTAGRVPSGGIVEQAPPSVEPNSAVHLQLHQSDFVTAARIAKAINKNFPEGKPIAEARNSALIEVRLPDSYQQRSVDFIAALEEIQVDPDRAARIVINEKTGTVVMGADVRIAPVAILHGNLTVEVQTSYAVSQPAPFSGKGAEATVVPQVGVGVKEDKARDLTLKEGATVEELVRALVAIGSTPRDVISILQDLKAAGSLSADIDVL